ncbi:MAG: radical SAM protein [Propionibacteriaceae bacterium]|nr:radical SAM protein [Propionibacteriaceae bacterium]
MRTAIFFKGCPLRCAWCHNPESQAFDPEVMVSLEGSEEVIGRRYSVTELVEEATAEVLYYDQSGGGVTLTGGEPTCQDADYLEQLAVALQMRGISVGIDTSGVGPADTFSRLAPHVDFFLYDLKFIDDPAHRFWTGASNALPLRNLELLASLESSIYLRLILLEGLNTDRDAIEATMTWLTERGIGVAGVNLLPYHRFGMDKYARLGRPAPAEFTTPTPETLTRIRRQVESRYPRVTIGG